MEQNIQMYKAKLIDGKLMLISTDIQVGNKVRSFNYPEQEEREVLNLRTSKKLVGAKDHSEIYHLADIQYPNEVNTAAVSNFFKIIGKISPEATWIKEGDEFDKEELNYQCYNKEKDYWYFAKYRGMWEEALPEHRRIQIKGPCGHFH